MKGGDRDPVTHRCVRMISEAAGGALFAAVDDDDETAELSARTSIEAHGVDLMEGFYAHLMVSRDAFLKAMAVDGDVRELFVLIAPDQLTPSTGCSLKFWASRRGAHPRKRKRRL